jgi:uncharacterized membrane protein YfcA
MPDCRWGFNPLDAQPPFANFKPPAEEEEIPLVAPGSVIALVAYAGAGQVDWRLGIPLAVGGVVAISAGVAFAHSLPERRLRFAFCGLLVLIAALLALHG